MKPRYAASCMHGGRVCLAGEGTRRMLRAVRDAAAHAKRNGHAAEVIRYDKASLMVVARWAEVA